MTNTEYHINAVLQILHDYCTAESFNPKTVAEMGTRETTDNIRTLYCTDEGREFHIVYSVINQCYTVETF